MIGGGLLEKANAAHANHMDSVGIHGFGEQELLGILIIH